jgi:hypothetical protein
MPQHHVATEADYSQVSKSIEAISVAIAGYDLWRAFGGSSRISMSNKAEQ